MEYRGLKCSCANASAFTPEFTDFFKLLNAPVFVCSNCNRMDVSETARQHILVFRGLNGPEEYETVLWNTNR